MPATPPASTPSGDANNTPEMVPGNAGEPSTGPRWRRIQRRFTFGLGLAGLGIFLAYVIVLFAYGPMGVIVGAMWTYTALAQVIPSIGLLIAPLLRRFRGGYSRVTGADVLWCAWSVGAVLVAAWAIFFFALIAADLASRR